MSGRLQMASPNNFFYTAPLRYEDGYVIDVTWQDEQGGYWVARLRGCQAETSPTGCGATQTDALACLACSLACLADSLHDDLYPNAQPSGKPAIRALDSIQPRSKWQQFIYRLKQIINYPASLRNGA